MPKGPKGEKRPGTMIEIVIERRTNAQGETDFRWSVGSKLIN